MHIYRIIINTDDVCGKLFTILMTAAISFTSASAGNKSADCLRNATVIYTTDVHGCFFPYDFIRLLPAKGSMARVATYIEHMRDSVGEENVVLLDNGDILQGQPSAYYYNYIDTAATNIASEIYNFLKYDAATVGNHDIETGHAVYDRWRRQTSTPILGANVIDRTTGQPYFKPYAIIERGGFRIAVIGLLTPAIPAWLPERLWSGLDFMPMEETARYWIDVVRRSEHPDVIIGLFHSGHDATKSTAGYRENESLTIARNVDGFDAVLMGHDHQIYCDTVINHSGKTVTVLNPANNAMNVGLLSIGETTRGQICCEGRLVDISELQPSASYKDHFRGQSHDINEFVTHQIAAISDTIYTRDAFFGPSAFMTLLHKLQLEISGADISMAAPLTFDGMIAAGPMRVADMFTLYKYENFLCTLRLSGKEIKDYLEFSYALWVNSISDTSRHLLRYESTHPTPTDNRLLNPSYNFDSADGIIYTVDITRPEGDRVNIISVSSGKPFDPESVYTVAINSYRAGGGGDHLTLGAGIDPSELKKRVITSTDKDLRYYMLKAIEQQQTVVPDINRNWRFIPDYKATEAIAIDRLLLFGAGSSKHQK